MRKSDRRSRFPIAFFAGLHLLCCGSPLLLLLSGGSLAFLTPHWPLIGGVVTVVGMIGFFWYLKRGCAICPRKEELARIEEPDKTANGCASHQPSEEALRAAVSANH